jgi:hypothetical protein
VVLARIDFMDVFYFYLDIGIGLAMFDNGVYDRNTLAAAYCVGQQG